MSTSSVITNTLWLDHDAYRVGMTKESIHMTLLRNFLIYSYTLLMMIQLKNDFLIQEPVYKFVI